MRPKLTPGQAGAEPVSVAASLFPARPPALPHARPAAVGPGRRCALRALGAARRGSRPERRAHLSAAQARSGAGRTADSRTEREAGGQLWPGNVRAQRSLNRISCWRAP